MTRRQAVTGSTMTAISYSRIMGANDRIGLGVIGTGGSRGTFVIGLFQKNPDVEVRALCDVYSVRAESAQQRAPMPRLSAFTKSCWNCPRWTRC